VFNTVYHPVQSEPVLVSTDFLEKCDNEELAKLVLSTMMSFKINWDDISAFVTDGAAYNTKAYEDHLGKLWPKSVRTAIAIRSVTHVCLYVYIYMPDIYARYTCGVGHIVNIWLLKRCSNIRNGRRHEFSTNCFVKVFKIQTPQNAVGEHDCNKATKRLLRVRLRPKLVGTVSGNWQRILQIISISFRHTPLPKQWSGQIPK
jgi:hypothetical protein